MENYATANRNTNLARGRLGSAYLFTKDTPVLGRRAPSISAHHQPSPLATSSTALNGSGNYLAPPTPQYQQLPQVTSEFEYKTKMYLKLWGIDKHKHHALYVFTFLVATITTWKNI